MPEIKTKAPMILGIGAALAGIFLLFRKKKPALPEPPPNGIVIGLLNPPSEAAKWVMNILDYSVTDYQSSGVKDITEAISFEFDQGWFPLRIEIWIDKIEDGVRVAIYHIQSFSPTGPDYQEIFIPEYGSYYYNMSKERFE